MISKKELNSDQIISLMSIYLSEWEHRDTMLWHQVFKIFYANLIVIIIPNIAAFLGIKLPPINNQIFPIVGILMAFVFLYIGLGYAQRLKASSKSYEKVMQQLGDIRYQRVPLRSMKHGKFFSIRLADLLVYTMFFALEILATAALFV